MKLACNPGITAQAVWRLHLLLRQRFLTLWGHVPRRVGVPISFGDISMKKIRKLIGYLSLKPDHEQRKMLGTITHGLALLVVVHYFINGKGLSSVLVLPFAVILWLFSYIIARKNEEEK